MEKIILKDGTVYAYVFVKDINGKTIKKAVFYQSRWNSWINEGWTLFGIFETSLKKPKTTSSSERARRKIRKMDTEGKPEGKGLYYSEHAKKMKVDTYASNWEREDYQYKLRKILKKAKELMAQGIDKTTALKVARACGCHG